MLPEDFGQHLIHTPTPALTPSPTSKVAATSELTSELCASRCGETVTPVTPVIPAWLYLEKVCINTLIRHLVRMSAARCRKSLLMEQGD